MRLWELEEGDGDEADRIGDREARERAMRNVEMEEEENVFVPLEVADAVVEPVPAPVVVEEPEPEQPVVIQPALQREGPLVLRINQLPPQPLPAPAAPEPARRHRNQNNNNRPQQQNRNAMRDPNAARRQRRINPHQAQAPRQNKDRKSTR